MDKLKIIKWLFSITVILLVINVILDDAPEINKDNVVVNYTEQQVETAIFSSLNSFNIKKEWIHTKKKQFNVDVPNDLPIVLLLKEITSKFINSNYQLVTNELGNNGKTLVKIKDGKSILFKVIFNYKKSLSHKIADVSILVVNYLSIDKEQRKILLNLPYKFTVFLTPSINNDNYVNEILSSDKKYGLLINNEIQDLSFKISPTFKRKRISQAIISISKYYTNSNNILLDLNSNNKNYKFIKSEFAKNGEKIIEMKHQVILENKNEKNLIKNFDKILRSSKIDSENYLVINAENLLKLKKELKKYKKLGYNFISLN